MSLLETMSPYRWSASWAVWGSVDHPEPFDVSSDLRLPVGPDLDGVLHARDVLVGLNQSTVGRDATGREIPADGEPWRNFHTSAFHNDHFLAEAFHGTDVWGAYMTDLHEQRESDSAKVHDDAIDAEVSEFVAQLRLLGATGEAAPRIVRFGAKAFGRVAANADQIALGIDVTAPLRIVKAPHWSRANARVHRAQISVYRDLVHAALTAA